MYAANFCVRNVNCSSNSHIQQLVWTCFVVLLRCCQSKLSIVKRLHSLCVTFAAFKKNSFLQVNF